MFAVDQMSAGWQAFFYALATACLVAAGVGVAVKRVSLLAIGLAFFTFVFFYNALAAT